MDIRNKRTILLLLWNSLFCSFGYYSFLFLTILQLIDHQLNDNRALLFIVVFTGVSYLLYPVIGVAADIYWTRYSVMMAGTILGYIGVIMAIPCFIATLLILITSSYVYVIEYLMVVGCVGIALYQVGLGLFRANAIQFGVDQLEFSSSQKISMFIYLYCWTIHILRVPCYILLFICTWISFENRKSIIIILAIGNGLFILILMTVMTFCFCVLKQYFIISSESKENPISLIYKVLLYAKHHKTPVSRSAVTYCEVPTRLDNAKSRYGGPFTTEQVEAVKTFGRILLLITCLMGANAVPVVCKRNFNTTISASFIKFYSILYVIELVQLLVIIPVYLIILKVRDFRKLKILTKVRIGLVLTVAANLLVIPAEIDPSNEYISLSYAIVAIVLYPMSFFLIFYLIIEFIFAQGPMSMQGLLIGIWYSHNFLYWSISLASQYLQLSIVKTCSSFLSLILFTAVSSKYIYRRRNEPSDINRQMIIEQYTERALANSEAMEQLGSD